MAITPLDSFGTAGIAGSYAETINPSPDPLITGDVPEAFTTDELVGASEDLPALTVVSLGVGGLAAAVEGTVAIGILVAPIVTGVGDLDSHAKVYRGGVFNPNRLIWDDSFTTDDEKRLAFEGAPSPTAIVIRAPKTMSV